MRFRTLAHFSFCAFSISLFVRCGSDKQGDAIGTLKTTEYPESYEVRKSEIFEAPRVAGPDSKSVFPEHSTTTFEKYSGGSINRLAVLVTDSASSWLGIAHGLKAIGIPFMVTGNVNEALRHQVVLVYPIISGALLSPEELQLLAAFPRNGGTIIGVNVLGALNEVFGFDEPVPSKQHFEIFMRSDSSDLTNEFTDEREQHISIGNKRNSRRPSAPTAIPNRSSPRLRHLKTKVQPSPSDITKKEKHSPSVLTWAT